MRLPRPDRWRELPRRWLVLGAVLVVVVLVAALLVVRQLGTGSDLQQAVAVAPAGSKRVSFTDWAAVRGRVLGTRAAVPASRVGTLVDRAFEADLDSASSISDGGSALARSFGFGPGNAEWESYAVAPRGASLVLRMADSVDLDDVAQRLRRAGFTPPADDDGVWEGGPDLVSRIDAAISPEQQYVVLDRGRHLVVTSDTAAYAVRAHRAVTGDAGSLTDSDAGSAASALAGRVGDVASAVVWAGDFACTELSMSQAAPEDEQDAAARVESLGGVDPLSGLVVAERADGGVRVALGFETDDQAVANLRPRAELVVGEDPSRPQTIGQTYRLTRSRTQGDAVLLDLRARPDVGAGLSTLTSGPVLFATC